MKNIFSNSRFIGDFFFLFKYQKYNMSSSMKLILCAILSIGVCTISYGQSSSQENLYAYNGEGILDQNNFGTDYLGLSSENNDEYLWDVKYDKKSLNNNLNRADEESVNPTHTLSVQSNTQQSFNAVPDDVEYQALVDLYNYTRGWSWGNKTNWKVFLNPATVTSSQFANFHGITVKNGDINEINLINNSLVGTLPSGLSNLNALEVIYLRNNNLSGTLPALDNLLSLKVFDVRSNAFTGSIPVGLMNSTQLTHLLLTNNQFSGSIPTEIENLANLEQVFLSYNQFSGSVPPGLGNSPNLYELYLHDNQFTGTIPPELGNAGTYYGLDAFYFQNNQLSGELSVALLKNYVYELEYFYVNNNRLTSIEDGFMDEFPGGPIYLSGNYLNFGDLEQFYSAPGEIVDPSVEIDEYGWGEATIYDYEFLPQNKNPHTEVVFAKEGEPAVVSQTRTGQHTNYAWNNGALTKDIEFEQIAISDAQTYHCTFTNDWIPGTIESKDYAVIVLSGGFVACDISESQIIAYEPSGAVTLSWYEVGNAVALATGTNVFNPPSLGDYYVETSSYGSTSAKYYFNIGSSSAINANAGPDQFLCATGTIALDASASLYLSGYWEIDAASDAGAILSNLSNPITTVTFGSSGIYIFNWVSEGECSEDVDQVTITYEDSQIGISSIVLCETLTYEITSTVSPSGSGFNYQWYDAQNNPISGANSNVYQSTSGTFTVRATKGQCMIENSIVLPLDLGTVNLMPTINTNDEVEYCSNSPVNTTFTLSSDPEYYSYKWLKDGVLIPGATENTYTATSLGRYQAEVTTSYGCSFNSNELEIEVLSELIVANAGTDQLICNRSTTLTGGGNFETGYWQAESWPDGVLSEEVVIGAPASATTTLNLPVVGEYVFSWNVQGVCSLDNTAQDFITISFDEDYYADISFTGSSVVYNATTQIATVCPGNTFRMNAAMLHPTKPEFTSGLSYQWYLDGDAIETNKTFLTTVTGTYSLYISGQGCTRETIVYVVPNNFAENIAITISEADPNFCPGETRTLSVPDEFTAYQWMLNGNPISGAQAPSITASQEGTYSVVITDMNNCADETGSIELFFKDNITINVPSSTIIGTTCDMAMDGAATIRLTGNLSASDNIPYEVVSSGGQLIESGTLPNNLMHDVTGLGAGNYFLNVVHPNTGCESSLSFNIPNGSPYLQSINTSSVSCTADFSTGETGLVNFTINRRFPEPTTGTYLFQIVGTEGYLYSGTGDFGVISSTFSLPYNQTYVIKLVADGVASSNACAKSFAINFAKASLTASAQPEYVICGEGLTADVVIDADLSVGTLNVDDVSTFGFEIIKDGTPLQTLSGETSPFQIELTKGSYTVNVIPSNPEFTTCAQTVSFLVLETDLVVNLQKTDVLCPNGFDGGASAQVTGGAPPYVYSWYPQGISTSMSSLSSVVGLTSGNYTLQVSDSRCSEPFIIDFAIAEPNPFGTISVVQTANSCEVIAEMSPPGGTAPYTFQWVKMEPQQIAELVDSELVLVDGPLVEKVKDAESNIGDVGGVATSISSTELLEPGDYIIRVTDAKGCTTESDLFVIVQPPSTRDYKITFRWRTLPIEEDESDDENGKTITNTTIASTSMGQVIGDQAQQCADNSNGAVLGAFNSICLSGDKLNDEVTLAYKIKQYHFTLYYYDRAGNLVRTVPPKGVNPLVPEDFTGGMDRSLPSSHTLVTSYNYNNWGQLVQQSSPDGGATSFAYNNIGQLRFSQNARQYAEGTFSYSKYDRLGRINEVGQADIGGNFEGFPTDNFEALRSDDLLALDKENRATDAQFPVAANNLAQQTVTTYSESSGEVYYAEEQSHLRNRVSTTSTTNKDGSIAKMHYSYDPHGNVKWLIQDIPNLNKNYIGYSYDLISGNVKQVEFNKGTTTPFYHRYGYDEDNRIVRVETSNNGYIWENDAAYTYFDHGPLQRTVLGEDKVQGIDYTYTLHGWLKAVNHSSLEASLDPGKDGVATSTVGKDAFGMALGYFDGDFTNSGSPFDPSSAYHLTAATGNDLYNGNISTWTSQVQSPTTGLEYDGFTGYRYQYDELNRIKTSSFLSFAANNWNSTDDYATDYSYDPNGNLQSLNRNAYGANRAMDQLTYNYGTDNNQLQYVNDAILDNDAWASDVDKQDAGNYTYDEIGNLTADVAEGISEIDWTVYGKVNTITHTNGDVVKFRYDAAGNRIHKRMTKADASISETFYVRDASGNVMGVYEGNGTTIAIKELPIYGSDRLGQYRPSVQLVTIVDGEVTILFYTGMSYLIDDPTDAVILGPGFEVVAGEEFYAGPDPAALPPLAQAAPAPADATHVRLMGRKQYELKDHLGNVRVVVTDRKSADLNAGVLSNYRADVAHSAQYYAFGMEMPGLNYNSNNYRYGFNGMEKDNEIAGSGNHYTAAFWEYDPRLGRRWNVDPVVKHNESPYATFANNPIWFIDPSGADTTITGSVTAQSEIMKAEGDPEFVPAGVKLESTAQIDARIVDGKFTYASAKVKPKEFESPVLGGIKPAFTELRNYKESISEDGLTATISYNVQTQLAGVEVFGQFFGTLFSDGTIQTNIITVTQSVEIELKIGSISTTFDGSTFPESRYKASYSVDTETKMLKGTVNATLKQSSYYEAVKADTFRERNHPQKVKKTLTY